jgi:SAM-dependent methyltransferase
VRDAEYTDPRLIEVYDAAGPWGPDDDFFLALVNETPAARVLDLGCGTGRLTIALAAAGHRVTGIDPSAASLAAARAKRGADRVTWIQGTAEAAPADAFDVAILTGHVAQFLLAEDVWADALAALRRALVPGGTLAFHAYDPAASVWERWNPRDSQRHLVLDDGTGVAVWTEVTSVDDDLVSYSHHYAFPDGERRRSDSRLRFWNEARLRRSVTEAGFTVERVHGGWRGEAVGAGGGELVVVARR